MKYHVQVKHEYKKYDTGALNPALVLAAFSLLLHSVQTIDPRSFNPE